MKKNLRVIASSFMAGIMTVSNLAVPGLSSIVYADDAYVDSVESGSAVVDAYADDVVTNDANLLDNEGIKENNVPGDVLAETSDIKITVAATQEKGFKLKDDSGSPVTVGGYTYTKHYETGGTNTEKTSLDGGSAGTFREAMEIVPAKDGTLSVACKINGGKTAAIVTGSVAEGYTSVDASTGTKAVPDGADSEFVVLTVPVKANTTYLFVGKGTNVPVYAVNFEADAAAPETTTETPTETTTAAPVETTTETPSETTTTAPVESGDLATPVAGKTYTADFVAEPAGTLDGKTFGEGTIKASASAASAIRDDAHGTTSKPGDSFQIAVAGNAQIALTACVYGHNTWTLTDASGNVLGTFAGNNKEAAGHETEADGAETAQVIDYKGDAGVLTLTYDEAASGETYVHKIEVINEALPTGQAESFSVWFDDIAKDATNADGVTMKTIEQQTLKYGDSELSLVGNVNTAYEDGLERFTPNNNNDAFMNLTRGDRTGVNAYKAGNRNANANDIQSIPKFGDGTALVFKCVGNGTFTSYVYTGSFVRVWDFDSATGERLGYTDTEVGVEYVAFRAQAGHTYVLSTTGKTNNCGFCSADFAVDQEIEVPVEAWVTPEGSQYDFSKSSFDLVDSFLGTTVATINKDTKSVKLGVGHTYEIKSSDAGVGVTFVETKTDKIKVSADIKNIQLSLVEIPDVKLSGDIITSDGNASDLKSIKFKNMINGNETEATISEDGKSYSASIKPGDYETVIDSLGYTTIDKVKVETDTDNVNTVYLKANDPSHIDLPKDMAKDASAQQVVYKSADEATPIRINNDTSIRASAGDQIIVPVSGKQKVTVAGWYSGTWDINGQNTVTTDSSANAANPTTNSYFTNGTETEVTITFSGDGANYLYWIQIDDVNEFDASNTVIQVPSEKFPTLKDANAYIASLSNRPEGEDGRITIELTDDIEEQIVFTEPYITVKGNGHTIHWYYGVGSFYYSLDKATGLYDEELFYDKYNSNEGDGNLWGGVAIIRGDHFIAEDTTFKNTYNYEVTEKDAADFDHSTGGLVTERVAGQTDVSVFSTKERSNAFYIDADDIQVYNCQILSSQDTLGRNGSANNGYHVYFKDSVIGGNVDYICGEFTAVFDNCELQWKTYSDESNNSKIGYIVAPKTSPYIFRNCVITTDKPVDAVGQFGRTWGAGSNATFMYTQTNGYIKDDAWGQMSSGDSDSVFYEYSNFSKDEDMALSTETSVPAVQAKVLPNDLVKAYTTDGILDVLTFTPAKYVSAADTAVKNNNSGTKVEFEKPYLQRLNSDSDVHTAVYTIGNDTLLIAAIKKPTAGELKLTIDGKVVATTNKVYTAIVLENGETITGKDLGYTNGYLYAVRLDGVRSPYLSDAANEARETTAEGFKVEIGAKEVADEDKNKGLEVVEDATTTA